MDGSVSTLAPIVAAAFATRNPHTAFLIGVSAAVGAGISMAFAEALSDTGELTGRGHPLRRGVIIGVMTFLGGIFHTVPFLISDLHTALIIAYLVVGIELMAIAYIRYYFFKMRFWLSIIQVVVGGALVFLAGILIGQA
jgi:VIT1/CCC1 family predicted Fe2+/Mn2+ transporter